MAHRLQVMRAALLDIAGLALGIYVLVGCWNALQAGAIHLPLGRRLGSLVFTAVRAEQPIQFILSLAVGVLFGTVFVLLALWNARMLVAKSPAARQVARAVLEPIEQAAPSGLAPLWWGVLVAVLSYLFYVAASR